MGFFQWIFRDHGPWYLTTKTAFANPDEPDKGRKQTPPTTGGDSARLRILSENAREVCKRFGHTWHRRKCVVCSELAEDATMEDVFT
jgi:hypothetical protein